MGAALEIKRRSRPMMVPIVGTLFVCYFLVHAFHGDRGIIAWMHLHKQVVAAEQTFSSTRRVRGDFQRRISLLKSEHLDADMLDERARVMVGLVRPDEIIVTSRSGRGD